MTGEPEAAAPRVFLRLPERHVVVVYVVSASVEFEAAEILAVFSSREVAERYAVHHRMQLRYVPSDLIYEVDEVKVDHPAEPIRNSYLNQAGWTRP